MVSIKSEIVILELSNIALAKTWLTLVLGKILSIIALESDTYFAETIADWPSLLNNSSLSSRLMANTLLEFCPNPPDNTKSSLRLMEWWK